MLSLASLAVPLGNSIMQKKDKDKDNKPPPLDVSAFHGYISLSYQLSPCSHEQLTLLSLPDHRSNYHLNYTNSYHSNYPHHTRTITTVQRPLRILIKRHYRYRPLSMCSHPDIGDLLTHWQWTEDTAHAWTSQSAECIRAKEKG